MLKSRAFKVLLIALLVTLVVVFFSFDLGRFLTLEQLREQKENLQRLYQDHQGLTAFIYTAAYIVMAALSLPGAAIMTLAGGAIFGLLFGTVLVSVASTAGATGAFLAARYLLGGGVQERFADKLKAINRGIEEEGAFYLFTLRLIPVFPFFVINLVMGLTPISTRTFFFVSQMGMLPGTIAYVNAGTQLSQIENTKDILSPSLILSFVIIGLLPLVSKKLLQWWKSKRKG